jgi:hypothetical protein
MSSAPLFSLGSIDQLADDEVAGIAISGEKGREGDVWVVPGIDMGLSEKSGGSPQT